MTKILYLYAELMGYQIPVLREYVEAYDAEVHVVHWDKRKLTPYTPTKIPNVTYYSRSAYNTRELAELAKQLNPSIVYVTAWQDKGYLPTVRMLRTRGVPIVAGFDDRWSGSMKQRVASLAGPYIVKRYFSHAWVAGPYQYEYARRLGFAKNDIIFNLLSGDTGAFGKGREYLTAKESNYPRTFLYVGNFRAVKGTDILVDAFRLYRTEYCGDWDLICVGNGEMRPLLDCVPGIAVREFSSQEDLVRLTRQAGVFVLPSRFDQWGVVVHEFAAAGMPLILSENVGASAIYMIEGFNGTVFRYNAPAELARAMHEMSKKSDAELLVMGHNSHTLAGRITPELVAASFLSVTR